MTTMIEREQIAKNLLVSLFNEGQEDWLAIGDCVRPLANCLTDNAENNKTIARGMLNCWFDGHAQGYEEGSLYCY